MNAARLGAHGGTSWSTKNGTAAVIPIATIKSTKVSTKNHRRTDPLEDICVSESVVSSVILFQGKAIECNTNSFLNRLDEIFL
jgi:hypothetical protein